MSVMVYLAAAVFGLSCTVLLRRPGGSRATR